MKMRKSICTVALGAALLLALSAPASADTVTIDFEALGHLENAHDYLAGFGITVSAEPGTALFALDETLVYGGGVVDAPSGTMYVSQIDASGTGASAFPPNTFTLTFATPLDSFGFSESAILVPAITSPWTATAYDADNEVLDTESFPYSAVHDTLVYTLDGPGISSVTFVQNAFPSGAFWAGNFDDFVLTTPVPEPGLAWMLGLAALGVVRWSRRRRLGA